MIIEDYVSFEVAKLLKDKGFNELCRSNYKKGVFSLDSYMISNIEFNNNAISAPTLQMAMKWLREVHNYLILIDVDDMLEGYQWAIYYADSHQITPHSEFIDKSSYEEACEAAIKYCLENLI